MLTIQQYTIYIVKIVIPSIIIAVAILLASIIIISRRTKIRVTEGFIHIKIPLIAEKYIPKPDLDVAYITDIRDRIELRIVKTLKGLKIGGWKFGWFKLLNGANALVAMSRRSTCIVIRLRNNQYLLLAPKDFSSVVSMLREKEWLT